MTRPDLPHVHLATLHAVAGLLLATVLDRLGEPRADLLFPPEAKAPWSPNTPIRAVGDAAVAQWSGVG